MISKATVGSRKEGVNICLIVISDSWGGAETVVSELGQQLRDKGYRVLILTNHEILRFYAGLPNIEVLDLGEAFNMVAIARTAVSGRPAITGRLPDRFPGSQHALAFLREEWAYGRLRPWLVRVLQDSRIDIVHAHLNSSAVLASMLRKATGIPTVTTLHGISSKGLEPKPFPNPLTIWKRRRLRKALAAADAITSVSRYELMAVEACGIRVEHKASVVPNGIDLSRYQTTSREGPPDKHDLDLLFPGGARWVKGGDIAVRAMPEVLAGIPGAHLHVAGNVPEGSALRRLVVESGLGEHVTFTGLLEAMEYRQLLAGVDMLVVPSREEGFGIVLLEAMAMGKPVIASNRGGIPEIIEDGANGVLVDPDPTRLAQAILELHGSGPLREALVAGGLKKVMRYDWRAIATRYLDLYGTLLGTEHPLSAVGSANGT